MASRIARYNFWAWQYAVRNPTFQKRVSRTIEFVESMRREGMVTETFTVESIAKGLDKKGVLLGGPVKSGSIPRKATDEETLWAKEILSYHNYFVNLNYEYADLKHARTSTNAMVNSLGNYLSICEWPKKKIRVSRWPFRNQEFIIDKDRPAPGLFKTKVAKHLDNKPLGGRCLIEVDLDSPIKVILAEIEMLYHFEHLPQTDDFETYDAAYEDCYMRMLEAKGETLGKDDNPRIVGLWLWDYLKQSGTTNVAAAIRTMQSKLGKRQGNGALESLGYAESSNRTFSKHLEKTKSCIKTCEVLPFS